VALHGRPLGQGYYAAAPMTGRHPASWRVPPQPEQVAVVRSALVAAVRAWEPGLDDDMLMDVRLCVSELISNAIVHTACPSTVSASWTGTRLRVEVADASLRPPVAEEDSDTRTRGRGLTVVQALAWDWGWYPAGSGKVVWFEIGHHRLTTSGKRLTILTQMAHHRAAAPCPA
jgi:anti-sigma regulatory factor (Ser/Thr protein kinase)